MQRSKQEKNYRIRKMKIDDLEEVLEIERDIFSNPWSYKLFQEEIENPISHCFVIEEDGKIVGYISYWDIVGVFHITNIGVKKEFQRKGYGSALLELVERIAKKDGVHLLSLEVRASNFSAIKFYEKHGFEKTGLRKNYYDKPKEDAIIMEKIVLK